jgi:hypothetical protein
VKSARRVAQVLTGNSEGGAIGHSCQETRIAAFGPDSALFDGFPQVHEAGFSIDACCVTIRRTLLIESLAQRVLRPRARNLTLEWLSRKANARIYTIEGDCNGHQ